MAIADTIAMSLYGGWVQTGFTKKERFICMKATGIVRRIDELGRIVIPKEIRRTMRIRESDPLEIFTDQNGGIILKKYSPIGEMSDFAGEYVQALNGAFGHTAAICDGEIIIAAAGHLKKLLLEKPLSTAFLEALLTRRALKQTEPGTERTLLVEEQAEPFLQQMAVPVVLNGDVIGGVLLLTAASPGQMGEPELQALKTASLYLQKLLEQ